MWLQRVRPSHRCSPCVVSSLGNACAGARIVKVHGAYRYCPRRGAISIMGRTTHESAGAIGRAHKTSFGCSSRRHMALRRDTSLNCSSTVGPPGCPRDWCGYAFTVARRLRTKRSEAHTQSQKTDTHQTYSINIRSHRSYLAPPARHHRRLALSRRTMRRTQAAFVRVVTSQRQGRPQPVAGGVS